MKGWRSECLSGNLSGSWPVVLSGFQHNSLLAGGPGKGRWGRDAMDQLVKHHLHVKGKHFTGSGWKVKPEGALASPWWPVQENDFRHTAQRGLEVCQVLETNDHFAWSKNTAVILLRGFFFFFLEGRGAGRVKEIGKVERIPGNTL